MTPVKFSATLLIAFAVICGVSAKGNLNYGDECSAFGSVVSAITRDQDESKMCNSDKGLICTGTCSCAPTRVWDKGFFGLFGGECRVAPNGPCSSEDKCVSNAKCGENLPFCVCEEGYRAHDNMCISGSSKVNGISGLAFVAMIVTYYMFGN